MLVFNDTSVNGAGSVKVFTCDSTLIEVAAGPVPDRFKDCHNNAFLVSCTDGLAMFSVNKDGSQLIPMNTINEFKAEATVQTADATPTLVAQFPIGPGEGYRFTVEVKAYDETGSVLTSIKFVATGHDLTGGGVTVLSAKSWDIDGGTTIEADMVAGTGTADLVLTGIDANVVTHTYTVYYS